MPAATKKKPASRRKAPVKKPAAKKAAAEEKPEQPEVQMVAPMHPDAFRLAMAIVNAADIKGGDAENVLLLKRELARVAGAQQGQPRA